VATGAPVAEQAEAVPWPSRAGTGGGRAGRGAVPWPSRAGTGVAELVELAELAELATGPRPGWPKGRPCCRAAVLPCCRAAVLPELPRARAAACPRVPALAEVFRSYH